MNECACTASVDWHSPASQEAMQALAGVTVTLRALKHCPLHAAAEEMRTALRLFLSPMDEHTLAFARQSAYELLARLEEEKP